eukprot:Rhum_TRINITY_DN24821_c0_g1::Rhum_TRINITY_DN24821_c0_g1_i1::g.180188::m.180188
MSGEGNAAFDLDAFLDADEAEEPPKASGVKRKCDDDNKSDEEVCAICQDEPERPLGQLNCSHAFCYTCISQWAKRSNVCPMCKKRFLVIKQVDRCGGKVIASKRVKKKDFEDYDQDLDSDDYISEDQELCAVCGSGDDPSKLFYCDYEGCENTQHSYCCTPCVDNPPPDGEFYCTYCFTEHSLPSQWTTTDPTINLALARPQDGATAVHTPEADAASPPATPPATPPVEPTVASPAKPSEPLVDPMMLPVPPPAPRPDVPQGVLHLARPPSGRTVAVTTYASARPNSVRSLREAFRSGTRVTDNRLAGLTAFRRRAAAPPRRAPPAAVVSSSFSEACAASGEPKRRLSLAQWSQEFSSQGGSAGFDDGSPADADGAAHEPLVTDTQIHTVEAMLSDLRAEIRRDREADPKRRQKKRRRTNAEVYAARAALAAAVATAMLCTPEKAQPGPTQAVAIPPEKTVDGVFVPTAVRNTVIANIKKHLTPAYKDRVLYKDQFRDVAAACLQTYLRTFVLRHRPVLLRNQALSTAEGVKCVSTLITSVDELAQLETCCRMELRTHLIARRTAKKPQPKPHTRGTGPG